MAENILDIHKRAFNTLNLLGILKIKLLIGLDRSKCGKSGCRGYINDDAFEFRYQTENCLKDVMNKVVLQVDKLPWHELFVGNLSSDEKEMVEELMTMIKKLAPLNGRIAVLFKAKCGCPCAKIEVWSCEDSRRRHGIASESFTRFLFNYLLYLVMNLNADKSLISTIFGICKSRCRRVFNRDCIS